MYKVIGSPTSRAIRVLWMLEELGEAYENIKAKPASNEVKEFNPSGRIPVLLDGDLVLTDSAAICHYLGDKHADKGLGAASPAESAQINSWLHFIQSELEIPLWNKMKHRMILPEELRVDVGPWCAWEFARDTKTLAKRLGDNEFAFGNRFTSVDIVLTHTLNWARSAKFGPLSETLNAYVDRMLARPAYERARGETA